MKQGQRETVAVQMEAGLRAIGSSMMVSSQYGEVRLVDEEGDAVLIISDSVAFALAKLGVSDLGPVLMAMAAAKELGFESGVRYGASAERVRIGETVQQLLGIDKIVAALKGDH